MTRFAALLLIPFLFCLPEPATAGKPPVRRVLDQVVLCFDETSFLREIGRWDAERYWPVLLWEPDLAPKFIAAFAPARTHLAVHGPDGGPATLAGAMAAVAAAWEAEIGEPDPATFLRVLRDRGRTPEGVVLLEDGTPDLLGGAALAAGRFHLPLPLPAPEADHARVSYERKEALRIELADALTALGVEFAGAGDELDYVTVANAAPFSYQPPPDAHPQPYTIDDAIARNDDETRWGYVGRLCGGPARSVYMAMGALFLQPRSGRFFSRYDPATPGFGEFDPTPALEAFGKLFPTDAIRHPDATLDRWRAETWPAGNVHEFLYVNSSGGARDWSTSKGGATHFDVPDSVPAIVHYTHSGSAGSPFDVDTIAGRWLAGGAYIYFGSHAEPYLHAFVPPKTLAARVAEARPLGAAMRHELDLRWLVKRPMKVGDEEREVPFNVSAPWKLAYFGDPSYRLKGEDPPRLAPEERKDDVYSSVRTFEKARLRTPAERAAHAAAAISLARLDPDAKRLVDDAAWGRAVRAALEDPAACRLLLADMMRVWIESMRRAGPALYDAKELRKLAEMPSAIEALAGVGAAEDDACTAGRLAAEFARQYVASIPRHPDSSVAKAPANARWALQLAASFPHAKPNEKHVFDWIAESAKALGIPPADLKQEILSRKWLPAPARASAETHL